MAAAGLYQQALGHLDPKTSEGEKPRLLEQLGRSYFQGAFQSANRQEFKRRMRLAEASYEDAASLHARAGSESLANRAKARALFSKFWLEDEVVVRRDIIEKCIALCNEASLLFERVGNRTELRQTHRDLLTYLRESFVIATERKALTKLLPEAVQLGLDAPRQYEGQTRDEGLVESLNLLTRFFEESRFVLEPSEFHQLEMRIAGLEARIGEICEKAETPRARCLAKEALGLLQLEPGTKGLEIWESALTIAVGIKDTYAIGRVAMMACVNAIWAGLAQEDPERKRALFGKALEFGAQAVSKLEVPVPHAYLGWAYEWSADSHLQLAVFLETDLTDKRIHLQKSVEIATKGMEFNATTWLRGVGLELGKAKYYLATMEPNPETKKRLLSESLGLLEEDGRNDSLVMPHSWNRGVLLNYSALVKAGLSTVEQHPEAKISLLQGATADSLLCIDICGQWATDPSFTRAISNYQEWSGDVLFQLYRLSMDQGSAQRAVQAYDEAITNRKKAGMVAAIAPLRWKIARVYDSTGNFNQAYHTFRQAADEYKQGAEKVQGLATPFTELSSYMEAWARIEDARLHHNEDQYSVAAENYEEAAKTLHGTKMWNYLSTHYKACSLLETGEALGREEKHGASKDILAEAAERFRAAKGELQTRLSGSTGLQEEQELRNWIGITEGRERYANGRIQLEEAQIYDRKGDKEASATRYRSASKVFSSLLAETQIEQSQKELQTLTLFCEALAKMKEADARASPKLYAEAAALFVKTEESAFREKLRRQALANASICRALESGSQFRLTRDTHLYADIKKNLESAADYYEEAGLRNAADWTLATQRLFDALVYLADAETEREPKKKTEFYHLAEKHLELAARLYGEAGFPIKKEEALRHVKRAREEKELLLTPLEALSQAPASGAVAVAPVSLIRDQALGLERFESANIVGNMSVDCEELSVGSDLTLEFELANLGKTAATLVKLENVLVKGLEIDKGKMTYKVKDDYVDLKGKRLEHLGTHEVKIPMKATRKGIFEIRPRVLFVDEKGNYKSFEFEPATLTAKELGISGWVKGPR